MRHTLPYAAHLLAHTLAGAMRDRNAAPDDRPARPPQPPGTRLLPPFLGELGLEIRYFLGIIEPWLRGGWQILARRPDLYPENTAIFDPELFGEIDRLKQRTGCQEIVSRLYMPRPALVERIELAGDGDRPAARLVLHLADNSPYLPIIDLERDVRRLVFQRIRAADRPGTFWDFYLTSTHDPLGDPFVLTSASALPPTYKPLPFAEADRAMFPHIGCQFRMMSKQPERNSDLGRVLPFVAAAAKLLQLPVVCYGIPEGCALPPNLRHSREFALPGRQPLAGELRLLKSCRVMFAPASGWTDVMGWLQVPTFIEFQYLAFDFEGLRSFAPRLTLLPQAPEQLGEALVRLLAADTCLPDPRASRVPTSHLMPGADPLSQYLASS